MNEATIGIKYGLNPPVEQQVAKNLAPFAYTIASESLIGIEVEVENAGDVNLPRSSVWHTETDGSLRNGGVEFITAPIRASSAPAVLNQLAVNILTTACHFSPRTSVHVHLNVQDLTPPQLGDLVLVYSVFERLFYKFVGRGRIRNIFCVPITETLLIQNYLEGMIPARWSKYTGLNLACIRGSGEGSEGYGTIEFRHMHGTCSVDKLCIWIDLITTLKDYVMKTASKDIRNRISMMDETFDFAYYLNEIFGDKAQYLKYEGYEEVRDSHKAAKAAMISTKKSQSMSRLATKDSPFYKFKG